MMPTDLFKQLDLKINVATRVYWWQHPFMQLLLVSIFLIVVTGVIVWYRRRHQGHKDAVAQQLMNVLHESVEQLKTGASDEVDVCVVISAVLKRYTAWLVNDHQVCGMTDQEWLLYIKNIPLFNDVLADCERLVIALDSHKFSGQELGSGCADFLLESAYFIMSKTSSGRVPEHAGCFISRLKRD